MAYYSIGDVAERCGINPVTLRAWQRRYGLLKPQRSEGGHRLFDEEDIQRIEEIKRWISNGVPVGKVKALLETTSQDTEDDWSRLQEEMMSILRMANPAKLRARIISLGREYPVDQLINHVYLPVLADPIESPRPELFPTQTLIVWTGMAPTRRQNELLQHWGEQGYKVIFHAP
ncbi:MerR family transcriptional regulator [Escherichia coli]|uniref:MerR family transcriptional regulator n=1 Tax=Escherichia coli TaxID=562 RepID=UPI000B955658|nr:MerR family transcriptional regulator [Escherichia coli]TNJ90052.1 MerR family transcriptional regulator [Escherichia coli]